jgi:hypothetical protein
MGKFKGQTIQLGAPERLLPTTSTGMDLREVRSQNVVPSRDGGRFGDRFARSDRPERSYDDAPPRRGFRDEDEGPRRTFSRRSEEDRPASKSEEADDWRSNRAPATEGFKRMDTSESGFERRSSTREEKPITAADTEDDWRSGQPSRTTSSAFGERKFESRDMDSAPPRRFASRQQDVTKADEEDDWRRGGPAKPVVEDRPRIERTRSSFRPATKADEESDWRTATSSTPAPTSGVASHSATPWARKTPVAESPAPLRRAPKEAAPVVAEVEWSSSESEAAEPEEVKPDMEKISKFAERVEKLVTPVTGETAKKIDSMVKKIGVNFTTAELGSFETARAVMKIALKSTDTISSVMDAVAPIMLCLEQHFIELGNSQKDFVLDILETVQCAIHAQGLPRLSPECASIESIWIALYESEIIPEEAFQMWLENDTLPSPGKSVTMFQTEAFRAWLYDLELPGVDASVQAKPAAKDEWASDSDDSDIEALVPKRAAVHLRPTAVAPLRR